MPRQARRFSRSGYMHVIIRGIGKQILFEERDDYIFFLKILKRYSEETEITVVAYCLMENHVHLLVLDDERQIAQMMRKLGVCYSGYYNRKYERTGHLFQDRFLSEAVDDINYLRIVFRYILMNPQTAGVCPAFSYEWSSIRQYGDNDALADTSSLTALIGDYRQYMRFLNLDNDDVCLEFEHVPRDDSWARTIMRKYIGDESGTVLQKYGRKERDMLLRQLKADGLTIRQLERMTGINRGVIQRA